MNQNYHSIIKYDVFIVVYLANLLFAKSFLILYMKRWEYRYQLILLQELRGSVVL